MRLPRPGLLSGRVAPPGEDGGEHDPQAHPSLKEPISEPARNVPERLDVKNEVTKCVCAGLSLENPGFPQSAAPSQAPWEWGLRALAQDRRGRPLSLQAAFLQEGSHNLLLAARRRLRCGPRGGGGASGRTWRAGTSLPNRAFLRDRGPRPVAGGLAAATSPDDVIAFSCVPKSRRLWRRRRKRERCSPASRPLHALTQRPGPGWGHGRLEAVTVSCGRGPSELSDPGAHGRHSAFWGALVADEQEGASRGSQEAASCRAPSLLAPVGYGVQGRPAP